MFHIRVKGIFNPRRELPWFGAIYISQSSVAINRQELEHIVWATAGKDAPKAGTANEMETTWVAGGETGDSVFLMLPM